jgi:hypothetical protein
MKRLDTAGKAFAALAIVSMLGFVGGLMIHWWLA